MRCDYCKREDLPLSAFFRSSKSKCRECFGNGFRAWSGQGNRVRFTRTCPICRTEETRLRGHYRKWHPKERLPVPALDVASLEDLHNRVLLGQRDADRYWSWGKEPGVYFVQAGGLGRPIKIGYSGTIFKRITEIQVGCPDDVEVLLTYPGTKTDELALHQQFASDWLRGEWFMPSEDLLTYIEDSQKGLPVIRGKRKEKSPQQTTQKRENIVLTYKSESQPLVAWAKQFNVNPDILRYRLKAGWSIGEVLGYEQRPTGGQGRPAFMFKHPEKDEPETV